MAIRLTVMVPRSCWTLEFGRVPGERSSGPGGGAVAPAPGPDYPCPTDSPVSGGHQSAAADWRRVGGRIWGESVQDVLSGRRLRVPQMTGD